MTRTSYRTLAAFLLALSLSAGARPALAQEAPEFLRGIHKGMSARAPEPVELAGIRFLCTRPARSTPFVAWAVSDPQIPRDHEALRRWLALAGETLGHAGLRPVFLDSGTWLGKEVWRYGLEHGGVGVWEAAIHVYWDGDRVAGLLNDVPRALAAPPDVPAGIDPQQHVLFPRWEHDTGRFVLDLVRVTHEREGAFQVTRFVGANAPALTSFAPLLPPATIHDAVFQEWAIPPGLGAFPDQIGADSRGALWISQPNNNQVLCLEPGSSTWVRYPTTGGGLAPDGLIVASDDIVWTGMLLSGHLGRIDPVAGTFTSIPPPSGIPGLAIPYETSRGTILATSHGGRVVEYDPVTDKWVKNKKVPTDNSWLLAAAEEPSTEIVWLTEHWGGRLARLDLNGGPITEVVVPGGGSPAFIGESGGKLWFSTWNQPRLVRFNPVNQQFHSFSFGLPGESGGPLGVAPNGDVVVGTLGSGYVVVYRKELRRLERYPVPGPNPNMKDGLVVDGNGDVWFTARNGKRIIRMRYPH